MNFWNNIYSHFDPVAFSLFGLKVHWYGLCYVLALLVALGVAKYFVRRDNLAISSNMLDNFFIWVEIGVILGARLGYIIIYDDNTSYYLTHPWQIFNPFNINGEFVGIRGMSYHGAVVGFIIATLCFAKKYKQNLMLYLDLCAISVPLGYFFGRVGNFLNQELIGRITNIQSTPWAIFVDGIARHPSQLYEAILEGLVLFILLLLYKKYKKFDGELIAIYAVLYTIARFACEYFREPDANIGFVAFGLSMGQILSIIMFAFGIWLFVWLRIKGAKLK